MEAIAIDVDHALETGDTIPINDQFLELAELYELRTANMLAFQNEQKRPTTDEFKDELRARLNAVYPTSDEDGSGIIA